MINLAFALAATVLTFAAAQGAPAQQWSVQVDTPTLNSSLNTWAASQGGLQTPFGTAQLRNLTAEIGDGLVTVHGTADTGWFSVPVDAAATASVQGGNVQVRVTRARIGGVDVPEAARGQLEQQLQGQLAQSLAAHHVVVRSVSLADGTIAIAGGWS